MLATKKKRSRDTGPLPSKRLKQTTELDKFIDAIDEDSAPEEFAAGADDSEADTGIESDVQPDEPVDSDDQSENEEQAANASSHPAEELVVIGDPSAIKERIAETVEALSNWKEARESGNFKGRNRTDVLVELTKDIANYYSYNEDLASYFLKLFGPVEAIAFFEAVEAPRPITLRTNLLVTRRRELAKALIQRGANVDPLAPWSKVGLKVLDSTVPIGATPEYCAGHYMLQAPSSFLSVMALAPQPGELVLDMAAAPGGKSTYIGQLMRNSGVLFCNELKKERCSALVANLHRMGVRNSVVINMDGRQLYKHLPKLDRVLIDAPCSGLGVISRDQSIKGKRTIADCQKQSAIQRELLAAAVDLVDPHSKTGGIIVYSTCSVAVEENEAVVDWLLKVRDVQVVPLGITGIQSDDEEELGTKGLVSFQGKQFHPSIANARRLYPHRENFDGFFVCKIRKLSDKKIQRPPKEKGYTEVKWGPEKWQA